MNAMLVLWFLIGILSGGAHVWILWLASQPPFHGVAWHLPRLLLVGGVLLVSAVWGALLPAIAGWVTAYFAAVGIVAMRRPS